MSLQPLLHHERRWGGFTVLESRDPVALLVRPHGFVTPSMIRAVLELGERFAAGHPEGWSWIVDVRGVRFVHPRNPFLLRRVPELPAIRHYVVIAPSFFHPLLKLAHRFIGADRIVVREETALAWCRDVASQ